MRGQLKVGLSSLSLPAVVLKRRASSFNESPGPTVISAVLAGDVFLVGDAGAPLDKPNFKTSRCSPIRSALSASFFTLRCAFKVVSLWLQSTYPLKQFGRQQSMEAS